MSRNNQVQLPIIQVNQGRIARDKTRGDGEKSLLDHIHVGAERNARVRRVGDLGAPDEGCCKLGCAAFDEEGSQIGLGNHGS